MTSAPVKKALPFLILSLTATAILAISYFRVFDNYELETLDFRFSLRPRIPVTDKVAMIEIGEDTIEKIGRFPFDRSYHALLIKALSEAGARFIVFDIFFSEPEEHDRELEDALRSARNVYLPFVLDIDTAKRSSLIYARGYTARTIENIAILTKGEGHINIAPDVDGKFRRVPLYVRYGDTFYPYVSFLMSCDYLGIPQKNVKMLPGKYLILGPRFKIPLDDRSNMIINFSGRWGASYTHHSYVDILQSYLAGVSGQKPILDLKTFKDRICIVGLTATGTVDLHPTPFESLSPGVGIHAEVFNSILNKRFISRVPKEMNLFILAILAVFTGILTLMMKPVKGLIVLASIIVIFTVVSVILFGFAGIWVDLFFPVMVMVLLYLFLTLYKYAAEWRKRLILENELDIAKKIQDSFLPKNLPTMQGVDIATSMFTARKVGGDLYDFVDLGPEKLGMMIGDVSGKGIPASLFMAMVTGAFKLFAADKTAFQPKDVLANLNSKLVRESSSNLFVTMFYMILDMKERLLAFSSGGHLPLLYSGADKPIEFLDVAEGTPLGLLDSAYSQNEARFNKGDTFVLYTDGVTEAMNPKSELYGKDRLAAVVESKKAFSAKDILNAIEKDIRYFEPRARQHDDMTLIVIKITG